MKAGTSTNSLGSLIEENNAPKEVESGEVTQSDINMFLDSVARAKNRGPKTGEAIPSIETERKIVEYYNRTNIEGFDSVGYFTFNGVNVYEKGKREKSQAKDSLTMEQKIFGGKT